MKEFVFPLIALPGIFANIPTAADAEGWWEKAQKNGVGFVFFVLFIVLMFLSYRREKAAETARTKREDSANAERLSMQTEIRDLNKAQLDQSVLHAQRLEQLVKDNTKAMSDHGAETRNLVRKMKRPCVAPFTNDDDHA